MSQFDAQSRENAPFSPTFSLTLDGVAWACPKSENPGVDTPRHAPVGESGIVLEARQSGGADGATLRWQPSIANTGKQTGPLVEDLYSLDIEIPFNGGSATLLWSSGDTGGADALLWHESPFAPGQTRAFAPEDGFSSCSVLPYFHIYTQTTSFAIAITWCGPWRAVFTRNADGIRVRIGPAAARFRLNPGEQLALPGAVLAQADGAFAHNALRARLLRDGDGDTGAGPPVSAYLDGARPGSPATSGECLASFEAAAKLGCEAVLLGPAWAGRARGDLAPAWEPDAKRFPQGLRPLADAAHGLGLAFGLWLEPERVGADSPLHAEHPEFLLAAADQPDALLDFGNPAARGWITDWVDAKVKAWGVDILRHAATLDPAPYWTQADEADRVGVAALRHAEGLELFWAELRRRHPSLRVDPTGAGGQRLDAAALQAGPALCRARKNALEGGIPPDPASVPRLARASQVQVAGLSRYVPLHAGPVWGFSPYAFRSAAAAGVTLYEDLLRQGLPFRQLCAAVAELKSIRPLWCGDYYPLCQLLLNQRAWFGFQLHRPDLDEGAALLFRRPDSPYPACEVDLHAIDPEARYIISITDESFEESPRLKCPGKQLARQDMRINTRPGSKLIRYRRLPDPTTP